VGLDRFRTWAVAAGARLVLAAAAAAAASVLLALAATAAPASAQLPPPDPATARLVGQFQLTGKITVASGVRGERAGQRVTRTWTFTPGCRAGACGTITLLRARAAGTDQLVLRRRSPGYYVGSGTFYAPMRCGRRVYKKGAAVPFTIAVRVTGAVLAGSLNVANTIRATYTNRSRRNLTPCFAVLGHDAAAYQGHVVVPTGGVGP
jgi:hypothetical protein